MDSCAVQYWETRARAAASRLTRTTAPVATVVTAPVVEEEMMS